jgi:hypothetical protein
LIRRGGKLWQRNCEKAVRLKNICEKLTGKNAFENVFIAVMLYMVFVLLRISWRILLTMPVYVSQLDPYQNIFNGLAEKIYLPVSYATIYPFSKILGYAGISMVVLLFFFAIVTAIMFIWRCFL